MTKNYICVFICLSAAFSSLETCACEMPISAAISICVLFIQQRIYIIFRSLGKYFGAMVSAKATDCAPSICKYLGITLLPQAGVALGMCTTAMQLGEQGHLIRNITLFAVLIYEIFGPFFTKQALTAAGDIVPMPEHVVKRREIKLEEAKLRKEK